MSYFTDYFTAYFDVAVAPASASSEGKAGAKRKPRLVVNPKWLGTQTSAPPEFSGVVAAALDDWTGSIAATFTPRDESADVFLFAYAKAA